MTKRLKTLLSQTLSLKELADVYNSYDIIGDIAIIRTTKQTAKHSRDIAQAIMTVHNNIKTVLAQTSPVKGEFRLRKLEHVAGEHKTHTIHKESGCLFNVDLEKCYFSPRLFHERKRIAEQVKPGEIIVNMFAGVGCFSILIAKKAKATKVYSIDINPAAVEYIRINARTNRVFTRVIPIQGDAKEIIPKQLAHLADRVLMPLPEKALEYLPHAIHAIKTRGGWIHYYDFEHAKKHEDPVQKAKTKVTKKLQKLKTPFQIFSGRIVRETGPNWYQIALDIKIEPRKQ
jgi:tRNA (guanine37-N1)-methyltransferase